jgi:hypothetical protein
MKSKTSVRVSSWIVFAKRKHGHGDGQKGFFRQAAHRIEAKQVDFHAFG